MSTLIQSACNDIGLLTVVFHYYLAKNAECILLREMGVNAACTTAVLKLSLQIGKL